MRRCKINPCSVKGLKLYYNREAQAKIEVILRARSEDKYMLALDKWQLENNMTT
jgi:hypothetical protein